MVRIGGLLTFNMGERTYRSSRYYKCPSCGERRIVTELKLKDSDITVDTRVE